MPKEKKNPEKEAVWVSRCWHGLREKKLMMEWWSRPGIEDWESRGKADKTQKK